MRIIVLSKYQLWLLAKGVGEPTSPPLRGIFADPNCALLPLVLDRISCSERRELIFQFERFFLGCEKVCKEPMSFRLDIVSLSVIQV